MNFKPYQNCETCYKCYSGKCQDCPKNRQEFAEFKRDVVGEMFKSIVVGGGFR